MGYKVLISTGKGKTFAQMGSTLLPTKERVANWVRRCPVGNANTRVSIRDTTSNKMIVGTKNKFSLRNIKW